MRHAALIFSALCAFAALPARAAAPELVGEVTAASARLTGPHQVTVCAHATVPTGGYTNPRLTPAKSAAHAGVYDLDFTAVRPSGIHTDMVSQISARFTWTDAPADLKAVRVAGGQGAVTAALGAGDDCG